MNQSIKQAVITAVTDDSSAYPQGQCEHNGKIINYTRLSPYGLDSNPPKDYHLLLLSSQEQEGVRFGMASNMNNRKKEIKENGVALYNPVTKSFIFIDDDGNIEIDSQKDVTVETVGNVTVTPQGSVTITPGAGATIDSSDVKLGGTSGLKALATEDLLTLFNSHTHLGVLTGPGVTGVPVVPASTEKTINTTAK